MSTESAVPETFLFTFQYQGAGYLLGIEAASHAEAVKTFAAMPLARKRALAMARVSTPRERDHVAELGAWVRSLFGADVRSRA